MFNVRRLEDEEMKRMDKSGEEVRIGGIMGKTYFVLCNS